MNTTAHGRRRRRIIMTGARTLYDPMTVKVYDARVALRFIVHVIIAYCDVAKKLLLYFTSRTHIYVRNDVLYVFHSSRRIFHTRMTCL